MAELKIMEKFNLTGKTALITGGAGLLGVRHAEALLSAGANCILVDIDKDALKKAIEVLHRSFDKSSALAEFVDITNLQEVTDLNERLIGSGQEVDILINNAAINPKMVDSDALHENSRFEFFSLEQWQKEIGVGLTGAFICCQVFGSVMAKKRGGVILNIASDLALIAPDQRIYRINGLSEDQQPVKPISYSVIKHALVGLTKYLATYWADKGVRVNALCPSGVYQNQPGEFVERLKNLIPLGRMAAEDEYQAALIFLVSEASSYMTGNILVIDGGRTCW